MTFNSVDTGSRGLFVRLLRGVFYFDYEGEGVCLAISSYGGYFRGVVTTTQGWWLFRCWYCHVRLAIIVQLDHVRQSLIRSSSYDRIVQ